MLVLSSASPAAEPDPCFGFSHTRNEIGLFGDGLKDAITRGDREAVSSMIAFPLRVISAPRKSRSIEDKKSFLAHYDTIITSAVAAKLKDMNTANVFCNGNQDAAMLGNGVVWLRENDEAAITIWVINK